MRSAVVAAIVAAVIAAGTATGVTLAVGAHGPRGLQGPPGLRGVAGTFAPSKVTRVQGPEVSVVPDSSQEAVAYCAPPAVAVGGGGYGNVADLILSAPIKTSAHTYPVGWAVYLFNHTSRMVTNARAYAVCAAP
jgi:hypothetical protein